jgi:hypothetical protein
VVKGCLFEGGEKRIVIESVNVRSGAILFVMLFEMVSASAVESRTVC